MSVRPANDAVVACDRKSGVASNEQKTRRIFFAFCSSGNVALKLSKRLFTRVLEEYSKTPVIGKPIEPSTLNALNTAEIRPRDLLLIVASTTGRGDIPDNGRYFLESIIKNPRRLNCCFAVFGNGSADYPDTYNQAALKIDEQLGSGDSQRILAVQLADTASENPPWRALKQFQQELIATLLGVEGISIANLANPLAVSSTAARAKMDTSTWFQAKIHGTRARPLQNAGITLLTLDVGCQRYPTMGNILILPPNSKDIVEKVLETLQLSADEKVPSPGEPSVAYFLRCFADLDLPFRKTSWGKELSDLCLDVWLTLPIHEAVAHLASNWRDVITISDLISAIPMITPREYSIASSGSAHKITEKRHTLDLLVSHHPNGRLSEKYLDNWEDFGDLTCKIRPISQFDGLVEAINDPMILFATGSGIAAIRGLLQYRLQSSKSHKPGLISLFAGYKRYDESLIKEAVADGLKHGIFEFLRIVPSNEGKYRAQHAVLEAGIRDKLEQRIKRDGAWVFVCARPVAAEGFLQSLNQILGVNPRAALGDKLLVSTYHPAG